MLVRTKNYDITDLQPQTGIIIINNISTKRIKDDNRNNYLNPHLE